MINLSKKAAKRFNIKWTDLPERSGDNWKVDIFMIGRIPMLLIVHEITLYTLVRRKSDFQSPLTIAEVIIQSCPWYCSDLTPSLGRNNDRRIVGSITEMKRLIFGIFSIDELTTIEKHINGCLFSYLSTEKHSYGTPIEALARYMMYFGFV